MENAQKPVETPQPEDPYETNKKQKRRLQFWFYFLVVLVAGISAGLIIWIFAFAEIKNAETALLGVGVNLTLALAPVLAAAAGVERSLETIFNVIENSWKSLIAIFGKGLRWLSAAQDEVYASRQWLADVSTKYNEEMEQIKVSNDKPISELSSELQVKFDAAKKLLDQAEDRLKRAENNLASVTDSDGYKNVKAAASIVLGLLLGLVVAGLGQLQMFAMLGVGGVNERVDVFITGIVIGTGSYPVHSLVGILQQAKDTLDGAKGYLNRANLKKVKEEVENLV